MAFVLYQQDIIRTRGLIHYNTKNLSAIRLSMVLKRMGIKNHTFFLILLQPELENVDPFSPDLDEATRVKILVECKLNPWYFFRECLKVPVAGGDTIHFQFSRGNIAAIWAFLNDIDFGLVMPRQTGKSYVSQSIICFYLYILADHVQVGHFDKSSDNCASIIRVIKDIRNGMPIWFWEKSVADTDRKESISYAKKENTYITYSTPIDEKSATKVARGMTLAVCHFDEIAFINYNWLIVPTSANSMLDASTRARSAGLPAPIIYTTTAGDPSTKPGAYALNIFQQSFRFTESLYDCDNREALLGIIGKNATAQRLFMEFSYRDLGKTDEWFKSAASRGCASEDDINRDLLNIWQSSSEHAVIPPYLRVKLRASKRDPSWTELSDGFAIRWYRDRALMERPGDNERPMIIGMDASENIERDFTTFTFKDPSTMATIGCCSCNNSNLMEVARFVVKILTRFPRSVWNPERKSSAVALIDFVLEDLAKRDINPYFRIFNQVIQNITDPKYKDVNIYDYKNLSGAQRKVFGFMTTGGSRDELYKQTMMKHLELNHSRIYDSSLINEYCALELRNGRVDHSSKSSSHDDLVFSDLLACYVLFFGRNLSYYGLNPSEVLSSISDMGKTISPEVRDEQIAIRQRIAELEDKINLHPTHILKMSYIRELQELKPMVNNNFNMIKPLAVTQMHEEAAQLSGATEINSIKNRTMINRLFSNPVKRAPQQSGFMSYMRR